MYLLVTGLVLTAGAVNMALVSNRENKVSKLVKDKVEAKASVLDFILGYLFGEDRTAQSGTYYAMIQSFGNCPDIKLSEGVLYYGTDKARQVLAAVNVSAPGADTKVSGKLDAGISFTGTFNATNSYSFKYEFRLKFEGNKWEMGACKTTYPNDPQVIPNCKPYDQCSQIAEIRGTAYRNALGLN